MNSKLFNSFKFYYKDRIGWYKRKLAEDYRWRLFKYSCRIKWYIGRNIGFFDKGFMCIFRIVCLFRMLVKLILFLYYMLSIIYVKF